MPSEKIGQANRIGAGPGEETGARLGRRAFDHDRPARLAGEVMQRQAAGVVAGLEQHAITGDKAG